jgi:UvrB/uvrC motif
MITGRYIEPVEPPPDPQLINHYYWLADPRNGASENERKAAVALLVELHREQSQQIQSGTPSAIDSRLLLFIRDELGRCCSSRDPLNAVESLLLPKKRPRGRPNKPHRDFVIAGDVAEMVEAGTTIDTACADVAEKADLSAEEVRRLYFREKKVDESGLKMDLVRRNAERKSLHTVRAALVSLLKRKEEKRKEIDKLPRTWEEFTRYRGSQQYAVPVHEVNAFFSSRNKAVKDELAVEMKKASQARDFERAAVYRDRLAELSAIRGDRCLCGRGGIKLV